VIALIAAMTAAQLDHRAINLAKALPPPGPWTCELMEQRSYCCQAPAQLIRLGHAGYVCATQKNGWMTGEQPKVFERFKGDDQ
jgi:hypothetical protein